MALARYLDARDDLHAGRTPRKQREGLLVRDLLNDFLTVKKCAVNSGDLTPRSFADYHATCERVADAFGAKRFVDDIGPN